MRSCDIFFFTLSFRNDISCLVPLNKLRADSFFLPSEVTLVKEFDYCALLREIRLAEA